MSAPIVNLRLRNGQLRIGAGPALPMQVAPGGVGHMVYQPDRPGKPMGMIFEVPAGRVIYQRWEYLDWSQVDYHHL